jgi:hypothetical protein
MANTTEVKADEPTNDPIVLVYRQARDLIVDQLVTHMMKDTKRTKYVASLQKKIHTKITKAGEKRSEVIETLIPLFSSFNKFLLDPIAIDAEIDRCVEEEVKNSLKVNILRVTRLGLTTKIEAGKLNHYLTGYYYSGTAGDCGWTAFYDFFQRIGVVDLPQFDKWKKFIRSGVWDSLFFKEAAIVCRRPLAVRRDVQQRLHSEEAPAIEWADGFKLYFINGVNINADVIEKPETLTKEKIIGETNVELRKAYIKILGVNKFLAMTEAEILDEDVDASGMNRKLFRFDAGKNSEGTKQLWCCVEVECPSKRDKHYLWVPPASTSCAGAVAWTFGIEVPDQYKPLVEA